MGIKKGTPSMDNNLNPTTTCQHSGWQSPFPSLPLLSSTDFPTMNKLITAALTAAALVNTPSCLCSRVPKPCANLLGSAAVLVGPETSDYITWVVLRA